MTMMAIETLADVAIDNEFEPVVNVTTLLPETISRAETSPDDVAVNE